MKRLIVLGFGLGLYLLLEEDIAHVRWAITYRYSRDGRLVARLRSDLLSAS